MEKRCLTIKIGGRFSDNRKLLLSFAGEVSALHREYNFIIVHGGGAEVSTLSTKILGKPPVFADGIRITSPEEMDIVEMVLSGKVNKRLVRLFEAGGINAVGICGADAGTFIGKRIESPGQTETRTGAIVKVNPGLVLHLVRNGYIPVLSSTCMDASGDALNINADQAAHALATALQCDSLVFISDIPGVLKNDKVIPVLTEETAVSEVAVGTISGGMIPKIRSSINALKNGVSKVIIGDYVSGNSLSLLLNGKQGTEIIRKADLK